MHRAGEPKLRRSQRVEFLNGEKKNFELKFEPPLAMAMIGDGNRGDRRMERGEIQKQLLRRNEASDKEACLPIFQ